MKIKFCFIWAAVLDVLFLGSLDVSIEFFFVDVVQFISNLMSAFILNLQRFFICSSIESRPNRGSKNVPARITSDLTSFPNLLIQFKFFKLAR